MNKITNLTTQARHAAKRGVAWALWSRRNAAITAGGILILFMFAFIFSTTGVAVDVQNAVRHSAGTPTPAADPLRDYTTKPRTPSELATGEVGKLVPKEGTRGADSVEQTASKFMTAWLAASGKDESQRGEWAASLNPYVTYALRDKIATIPMGTVPTATVTSVEKATLMSQSTVTVTLSSGQLVILDMMFAGVSPGQWMVQGMNVTSL